MASEGRDPDALADLAERAFRGGDYEVAARIFHRLMVYYGILNDELNRRRFALRAGECYMLAAEGLNNPSRAMMLYFRAALSFMDGGSSERAYLCRLKIWDYYTLIAGKSDFRWDGESIHALKLAGDLLADCGDLIKAAAIYHNAAERAVDIGKYQLAGGLYRDAGDCYKRMDRVDLALESYLRAAEAYFRCRSHFEAAWNYCEAGFMLLHLNRFREALEAAEKAELACREGQIEVFLKDLSRICWLLSQGLVDDAKKYWDRIRGKLRGEYVRLIESSFRAVRSRCGSA